MKASPSDSACARASPMQASTDSPLSTISAPDSRAAAIFASAARSGMKIVAASPRARAA